MHAFRALVFYTASLIDDDTGASMHSTRDYVIEHGTKIDLQTARARITNMTDTDPTWVQRCMDRMAQGECLSFTCYGANVYMAREGASIYTL